MMVGNVFVQDARISFVSSLKRGERGYNSYNCMESTPTNQNSSPSNGFNNMHHAFGSCNNYLCAPMLKVIISKNVKSQIEIFLPLIFITFKTLCLKYLLLQFN